MQNVIDLEHLFIWYKFVEFLNTPFIIWLFQMFDSLLLYWDFSIGLSIWTVWVASIREEKIIAMPYILHCIWSKCWNMWIVTCLSKIPWYHQASGVLTCILHSTIHSYFLKKANTIAALCFVGCVCSVLGCCFLYLNFHYWLFTVFCCYLFYLCRLRTFCDTSIWYLHL